MVVPTVRRRRLGAELRRLRDQAGLTLENVQASTGLSVSKVSRIESAARGARPADVAVLLDLYRVEDVAHRDFLMGIAKAGGQRGWWHSYDISQVYSDLIGLEADASSVSAYEAMVLPGLLQTAAYARAVISAHALSIEPDTVNALVEIRMARQSVLTRPQAPNLRVVIHEAALHVGVPGQGVMREQMQRLLDVAEYPHVTVQVLPLDTAPHPGLTGGFSVLGFEQPGFDVVLLEQLDSSLYVEEPVNVAHYAEAFRRLAALALAPDPSLSLITRRKEGCR